MSPARTGDGRTSAELFNGKRGRNSQLLCSERTGIQKNTEQNTDRAEFFPDENTYLCFTLL